MAMSLDQIYEAISAMQSTNPAQNGPATRWLEEFQKTVYAWTVADQILNDARSFDACLFAAQIIRNKVAYSLRELPTDSYGALRDSLLSQLINIETKLGRNASSIITQLCAALSDLYIQVVEWHGFVSQMISQLVSQAGPNAQKVLLALFRILPEELYSKKLKIGENRRIEVEKELAQHTQQVMANLSELCAMDGAAENGLLTSAVRCLASWLLNKKCPTETLAASPLLHSIISCLGQQNTPSDLHDAATECTVNALQLIDDQPTAEQQQLARILQQGIIASLDAFRNALHEEDMEKLQNYARLYAENCEAFLTEMVKHPREGFGDLRSLDMMQLVNDYHDYSLVEMGFNVWYRLSEYLYQCEEAEFEEIRNIFSPYVEKHILALCRHCRAEPDTHELLDSRSELADFRNKAQESVKDVTFIIGSVELLRRLVEVLNSADSWDQMEAILFIISSFVPNIVETELMVVPTLLENILKLPMVDTHKQLLKTSAQLLGNLQDWLQANADYMVRTFNWFCSLFEMSGGVLALTVAECLEQLLERGWAEIQSRGLHEPYLSIMENLLNKLEQSQNRGQETEQAAQHLLKASTHLVNDLPSAQLCAALERLCAKPIARLNEINRLTSIPPDPQPSLAAPRTEENKENMADAWLALANDPILWLDRLSAVWRILKPWQQQLDFKQLGNQELAAECPWFAICRNVIECAMTTLQQHQEKQRVVEHACRTIRFLIRSMGAQSIVFIEPLASQIVRTYAQYPHSCLIYLASILVDEYGKMGHVQQGMRVLLENLATRSLTLLATDPQHGFRDNPDTVDDLYRMAIRYVQRCPSTLFSHPVAIQLLQGAIHGLSLDHQDANRSITKFLTETIQVARGHRSQISLGEAQQVYQLITQNGNQLMFSAVSAALFHLSNSLSEEMAELVFNLINMDKQTSQNADQWLAHTCLQLPHDGGHSATPEQLMHFRTELLSAKQPWHITKAIRELRKFYA